MTDETQAHTGPIVTRKHAKAAGIKRYFTGKPCANSHVAERNTRSAVCLSCCPTGNRESPEVVRARANAWYASHGERGRARSAAWVADNPERAAQSRKAWALRNAEKKKLDDAAYFQANKEKYRALNLSWIAAHPEKNRSYKQKWGKANPEAKRCGVRNRRARLSGNGGKHTKADISALMKIQSGKCAHTWCRVSLKSGRHVDHIMPLAKNGQNDRKNLQLLCVPCNLRKNAKHPIDFAQQNGMLL